MSLTRRDFCGLVTAGLPVAALELDGRAPARSPIVRPARPADPIRLDSNENPYGPFPSARAAITRALTDGARYPSSADLVAAVATSVGGVAPNVMLTVGATEGLGICARAFTRPDAPLVTAAPTYAAIATATEALGHPVVRVPILPDGPLDLDRMADAARGAGIVYLCNPNNPTGTLIPSATLEAFIDRVLAASQGTVVVVGEAYHEYIASAAYRSAATTALRNPRVLVNRTFSKLYGLAGMRLGYLVGAEETIRRLGPLRVPLGANAAALAAAQASLADENERRGQRDLNTAGRRAAERFFGQRGWRSYPAEANYLLVDIRRDVTAFRTACQAKGLLIGRHYPPADTWARITIGTPDEMARAFTILESLL